jgi:periplasmic protein CpxP/Spy
LCALPAFSIHFIANPQDEDMKTSKLMHTPTAALRLMALTVLLAIGATAAQTASAQHHGMRGGEHRSGHGGDEMGMGSPRMLNRMLDAVQASADQRAQIKQITDAARADMKAQHDSGRQLRADAAALFAQPTVDARAAEALRQQMLARHDQASKRQLQMMLDISRVLTPEQRKSLADKFAQRRAMMERHRAERAASEPKPAR